ELGTVLGILSSPTSPLKRFLEIVADNTNLLKEDPKDAADKLEDKVLKPGASLAATLGITESADAVKPGAEGTAHFEAVRNLVDGPPGGTQMDRTQAALKEVAAKLAQSGGGAYDKGALSTLDGGFAAAMQALELEARQLPPPLGDLVTQVSGESAGAV